MRIKETIKNNYKYLLSITILLFLLFASNKTLSRYNTSIDLTVEPAMPVVGIEAENSKTIEFAQLGWLTYQFDIINGAADKDGSWHTNELDMEYYINIVPEEENVPLNLKYLYRLKNDWSIDGDPLLYIEGKGYGPFSLMHEGQKDEEGYQQRTHYTLVYTWGDCEENNENCERKMDASYAGRKYKFHIEIKAYQKTS